jgi:hypothetical protein
MTTELSAVVIAPRHEGSPLTGGNVKITIDGVEVKGATFARMTLHPGELGVLELKLILGPGSQISGLMQVTPVNQVDAE